MANPLLLKSFLSKMSAKRLLFSFSSMSAKSSIIQKVLVSTQTRRLPFSFVKPYHHQRETPSASIYYLFNRAQPPQRFSDRLIQTPAFQEAVFSTLTKKLDLPSFIVKTSIFKQLAFTVLSQRFVYGMLVRHLVAGMKEAVSQNVSLIRTPIKILRQSPVFLFSSASNSKSIFQSTMRTQRYKDLHQSVVSILKHRNTRLSITNRLRSLPRLRRTKPSAIVQLIPLQPSAPSVLRSCCSFTRYVNTASRTNNFSIFRASSQIRNYHAPTAVPSLVPFLEALKVTTGLSWGGTAIATALAVKVITWPIYLYTLRINSRMAEFAPEIAELNASILKYKSTGNEQCLQEAQTELSDFLDSKGINMIGQTLAPFIQLPIFVGVFNSLRFISSTLYQPQLSILKSSVAKPPQGGINAEDISDILSSDPPLFGSLSSTFLPKGLEGLLPLDNSTESTALLSSESFGHLANLSDPDPLMLLPSISAVSMALGIRSALKKTSPQLAHTLSYLAFLSIPITAKFPSLLQIYFTATSVLSLSLAFVARTKTFRYLFGLSPKDEPEVT